MKKRAFVLGLIGVVTGSVASEAAPERLDGSIATEVAKGAVIVDVKPTATHYTGGAIAIQVAVKNLDPKTALNQQVAFFAPGAGLFARTVAIDPGGVANVLFQDTVGFDQGGPCLPRDYLVEIQSPRRQTVKARVTPTCTFATKVVDPWDLMTPDSVEYKQKNKIYISGAGPDGAQTCPSPMKLKAGVVNHSPQAATVRIDLLDINKVRRGGTAAFTLAHDAYKTETITAPLVGTFNVLLVNTNGSADLIASSGMTVTTTASCTLATTLIPMP